MIKGLSYVPSYLGNAVGTLFAVGGIATTGIGILKLIDPSGNYQVEEAKMSLVLLFGGALAYSVGHTINTMANSSRRERRESNLAIKVSENLE